MHNAQVFSSRAATSLAPNRLSRAVAAARDDGRLLLNLTESNPTVVDLPYPESLLDSLASPAARVYNPSPFGLHGAREAVARHIERYGAATAVDQVVLTASTSDAYGLLFKVLCDPDDEVLVPEPSYPLFEHLTRFDAARPIAYRLEHHGLWSIDRASVERSVTDRTRAMLVVSPNNPTGALLRADDREWLDALCASRSIAVISDEVFADYRLQPAADGLSTCRSADRPPRALTFVLGGISKSLALPQLKLAWIVADGPASLVADALARLSLACDTYLSVATPVQVAIPALFERGAVVREALIRRIRGNLSTLDRILADAPHCTRLRVEGGWSAVVRIPAIVPEEDLVVALVEREGVLVHPGYFFDFPSEAYLVLSLIVEPSIMAEGLQRLVRGLKAAGV